MNILIVYAHPNPKSFCHAILEKTVGVFKTQGDDVRVRDLYDLKFNPILASDDFIAFKQGKIPPDIVVEQEHIRWANLIVIIFPIWWASFPAILKGYFDRVFSFGFAFTSGPNGSKGLLTDKSVYLFNTQGNSHEMYSQSGMFASISQTTEQGVLAFSGIKVIGHQYFTSVPSVSQEVRAQMLEEVATIVKQLK